MRRKLVKPNVLLLTGFLLSTTALCIAVDPALVPPAEQELTFIGKPFIVKTPDGVALAGRERIVENSTGTVIMLPMVGNTMESYSRFAADVAYLGLSILSCDLRGHGESTKSTSGTLDFRSFKPEDWSRLPDDLTLFIQHVKNRKDRVYAIIGAGIGADAAIVAAAANSDIPQLMLISPGELKNSFDFLTAASKLGKRDIVIMYATNDDLTLSATQEIRARAAASGSKVTMDPIPSDQHGTILIFPSLRPNIIDWLLTGTYIPFDALFRKSE